MQKFGAHEIMEAHEVLTNTISSMNIFNLLRDQVTDQELSQIMDRQISFMEKEYNDLVSFLSHHRGVRPEQYHSQRTASVNYGLRQPSPVAPHERRKLTDRDAASIMLSMLKCGASRKMMATLECADPQLRRLMMQGANSCSEQAYELFIFMNQRGMYQVPTMQQQTQENFVNIYQQAGGAHGIHANPAGINITGLENRGFLS